MERVPPRVVVPCIALAQAKTEAGRSVDAGMHPASARGHKDHLSVGQAALIRIVVLSRSRQRIALPSAMMRAGGVEAWPMTGPSTGTSRRWARHVTGDARRDGAAAERLHQPRADQRVGDECVDHRDEHRPDEAQPDGIDLQGRRRGRRIEGRHERGAGQQRHGIGEGVERRQSGRQLEVQRRDQREPGEGRRESDQARRGAGAANAPRRAPPGSGRPGTARCLMPPAPRRDADHAKGAGPPRVRGIQRHHVDVVVPGSSGPPTGRRSTDRSAAAARSGCARAVPDPPARRHRRHRPRRHRQIPRAAADPRPGTARRPRRRAPPTRTRAPRAPTTTARRHRGRARAGASPAPRRTSG